MNIVSFTYSGKALSDCMMSKILRLEKQLMLLPQVECPIRHTFRPGEYEREMTIPAWTVLSGAEHTVPHIFRLVSGMIEVMTPEGIKMIAAPYEFLSGPGIKRIGRTFDEPAVVVNIFENMDDCEDLDIIIPRICTSKNCDLLENSKMLKNEVKSWLLE